MAKKTSKKISTARKVYLDTAHLVRFLIRFAIATVTLVWAGGCLYLGIDSTAWPVTSGQMQQGTAGGSISYTYNVNGNQFESTRVRFGDLPYVNSDKEFLTTYSPGAPLVVRYNPDMPGLSTLLTGFERLGVFVPLGIGAFFFITAGVELRSRYLIR